MHLSGTSGLPRRMPDAPDLFLHTIWYLWCRDHSHAICYTPLCMYVYTYHRVYGMYSTVQILCYPHHRWGIHSRCGAEHHDWWSGSASVHAVATVCRYVYTYTIPPLCGATAYTAAPVDSHTTRHVMDVHCVVCSIHTTYTICWYSIH